MNVQSAKLVSIDAHVAGDSIIEVGRAQLLLPGNQCAAVKYVVEWKQEGQRTAGASLIGAPTFALYNCHH